MLGALQFLHVCFFCLLIELTNVSSFYIIETSKEEKNAFAPTDKRKKGYTFSFELCKSFVNCIVWFAANFHTAVKARYLFGQIW